MKYVICEEEKLREKKSSILPKSIVLFSEDLSHCDMVPAGMRAVSAGFVSFGATGIHCTGPSSSLKCECHADKDALLIGIWWQYGSSMMVMASVEYDEA